MQENRQPVLLRQRSDIPDGDHMDNSRQPNRWKRGRADVVRSGNNTDLSSGVTVQGAVGFTHLPVDTDAFPTIAVLDAADDTQSYRPGETGSMAVVNG